MSASNELETARRNRIATILSGLLASGRYASTDGEQQKQNAVLHATRLNEIIEANEPLSSGNTGPK